MGGERRNGTARRRKGFLFHGSHLRFDAGARGAVRDWGAYLTAPHSFQGMVLGHAGHGTASGQRTAAAGGGSQRAPSPLGGVSRQAAHAIHRRISRNTSAAMLDASVCFAPRGDTDTSRRLFDALASGCVPVIVRVIGGTPSYTMLANLPFHHSINWRSLAYYLSPGLANLQGRDTVLKPSPGRMACRREEAALLDKWHNDEATLERMRRNAVEVFSAFLDVELHPRGVADAFLRELSHVLTDVPASLFLPPPNVLPMGMRQWANMTRFQFLWKRAR